MRYAGDKGKAWEAAKEAIRSYETDCYTCGAKNLSGANAQAGHYFDASQVGSNNVLFWTPEFIHLQCDRCNGELKGNKVPYRAHLVRDFGEDFVADAESRRYRVAPIKNWHAIIILFTEYGIRQRAEEIKKQRGGPLLPGARPRL